MYSAERHYDRVKAAWLALGRGDEDAEDYIQRHVMRLEGHERRGLVRKLQDGLYSVPSDLKEQLERLAAVHRDRGSFVQVTALSPLPLNDQVRAIGASWLDEQLARGAHLKPELPLGASTAERQVATALRERVLQLEQRGFDVAQRRLTKAELDRLYGQEIAAAARRLSATYGAYLAPEDLPVNAHGVRRVRGRLARFEGLTSAPHAVVTTSAGFLLVPARGAVAQRVNQEVAVEIRPGRAPDLTRPTALQMTVRFAAIERERSLGRGR